MRFSSWAPSATSSRTSARRRSGGFERKAPRICGMMQKVQGLEHPSLIRTKA